MSAGVSRPHSPHRAGLLDGPVHGGGLGRLPLGDPRRVLVASAASGVVQVRGQPSTNTRSRRCAAPMSLARTLERVISCFGQVAENFVESPVAPAQGGDVFHDEHGS